ncbi:hypothetical protein PMAYCL1PPCAC_27998, partial [Pristionchus mayeri]
MSIDEIFLSLDAQRSFFLTLRIIFCFSVVLHLISLFFLCKHSPPTQVVWRNYMLNVQIWIIVLDVYLELLLEPVPLFPAPAGYTTGFLCRVGVPVQVGAGIGMLMICNLAVAVILCVLHRHQTILMSNSRFRLGKLITPLILMLLPAGVIFTAITADGLIEFEQCLFLFSIMMLHPIAHNILLISLTPNFRAKI